jgi:molecular chaperone DnaK
MVGGSSRIPLVQESVRALFGKPLNKGFNPDEVVAVGAAIQAGILEGDVKSVTLLDVTNFSLGIEVSGGRFARLIPKNSTIPAQHGQLVSTVVDNQRTVKIHVLQGESPRSQDNVSLGEFELRNIQPAPKGEPRIRVRFSIDANGIVNVEAQDTRTGLSEQITIDAPTGLSREEVSEMRAEAADAADEQGEAKEVKRLRSEVERQLVVLESLLRDSRGSLHKSDLSGVEAALKRGRMALLKSSDRANLSELLTYLQRFHGHLSAKLDT